MSNRANGRKEEYGEYFMKWAMSAKSQSEDGNCKVGACIVSQDDQIISIGYNHMPKNENDLFPFWKNKKEKLLYVCHAELNAIVNSGRNDFSGCRMYVTRMPCDDCAKLIIQYKIKEVFYEVMEGKSVPACTEKMFDSLKSDGFVLRKFENSTKSVKDQKFDNFDQNSPSKKKIERQSLDSDDYFLSLPTDSKKRKL